MYSLYERMQHYKRLAAEYEGQEFNADAVYVFKKNNPYRLPFQVLSRAYWRARYTKEESENAETTNT
jgi:hypothetical protein